MQLPKAAIGMIALTALMGCGGYTASGLYGGNGAGTGGNGGGSGGGGGGGPVGSVIVGNMGGIVFTGGHNGTTNPAVDTVAAGSRHVDVDQHRRHFAQRPIGRSDVIPEQRGDDGGWEDLRGHVRHPRHLSVRLHGQQMRGTIVVR